MGHVNKVSHVFTLGHVAEMLGEDEEWLFEVAEEMDTEDGQLWIVGVGEDGVMAFTDDGIENLKNLIAIHKDDPSIIEERRQALATMIKPKTQESDEVPLTGQISALAAYRAWLRIMTLLSDCDLPLRISSRRN
jgi:hypothetical protein